jgi:hypothetical protein
MGWHFPEQSMQANPGLSRLLSFSKKAAGMKSGLSTIGCSFIGVFAGSFG